MQNSKEKMALEDPCISKCNKLSAYHYNVYCTIYRVPNTSWQISCSGI